MQKYHVLQAAREYLQNKQKKKFIPGKSLIPPSNASIDEGEIINVIDAALNGWFTEGAICQAFLGKLKEITNNKYGVLCNSGSSANLLALALTKNYGTGKKFIVTCASGFITTVAPIIQNGFIPIFIDIDPITLSPNIDQLVSVMKEYRKDIEGAIFTHTLGIPFNELEVYSILGSFPILITDCCDALGASVRKLNSIDYVPVGSYSYMSTYSFFPAHHITTGQGGAVLTNDEDIYSMLKSLVAWGRSCYCKPGQNNTCGKRFQWETNNLPDGYDHKYIFDYLGYNLQMTELQGAIGYRQIHRLDEFHKARLSNFDALYQALFQYLEFIRLIPYPLETIPSPFGFPIIVRDAAPFTANDMIGYLEDHKIGTRRIFGGNLLRQPAFEKVNYIARPTPGADYLMNNGFWIGCHPSITDEMLDYMLEVFEDLFLRLVP